MASERTKASMALDALDEKLADDPAWRNARSPIRGRWCDTCRGGCLLDHDPDTGEALTNTDPRRVCSRCGGSGFVGVTCEQVRQAELMAVGQAELMGGNQ